MTEKVMPVGDRPAKMGPDTARSRVSLGYNWVTAREKKKTVRGYFDAIALRYDRADTLLSFGLHFLWKRRAIQVLGLKNGDSVLDLCGGTAELALRAAQIVAPKGTVAVYDISRPMMLVGQRKAKVRSSDSSLFFVQGDAEKLGFKEATFDAVMVGLGMRNLVHLTTALQQIRRVLKTDGRFVFLEFSLPLTPWFRSLYDQYSFRIMPHAGRMVTGSLAPFKYLAESIRVFPRPEELISIIQDAGFSKVSFERLTRGLAVLYTGRRA